MAIKIEYNIGDNVISKDGVFLGQYMVDKTAFIIEDVDFLKERLLSMGAYSMAQKKNSENKTYNIYGKRKIFTEEFGSIDQFLVKIKDDLEWKELSSEKYEFIDLDY